ncbi:helix-turn-helix domain-containing protein [Microseira sp. BLCC-F43]|uniref:helix-turn-helix domain-containing protein n=1 Tax=Microseira sp. BLCC-F43 TaxID=3153602 RepID=UPI0035B6CE3A
MLHKVVKVSLYPTPEQQVLLAQSLGCDLWWWNYALSQSIDTYKETGKGWRQSALNALLTGLKKAEETKWIGDCYSQNLPDVTRHLKTVYKKLFDGQARFPRVK